MNKELVLRRIEKVLLDKKLMEEHFEYPLEEVKVVDVMNYLESLEKEVEDSDWNLYLNIKEGGLIEDFSSWLYGLELLRGRE